MKILVRLFLFQSLLALSSLSAQAAGLNDTGITSCYNSPEVRYLDENGKVINGLYNIVRNAAVVDPSTASDSGTHPRQDCRYGRDAAAATTGILQKIGTGTKGFDFTKKSDSSGTCVTDNVTKLMWEIKPLDGLRRLADTYAWYSSDTATNGDGTGSSDASTTTCSIGDKCTTDNYVKYVNKISGGLCGFDDWRLPTRKELLSIVDFGRSYPAIDTTIFSELDLPIPVCRLDATAVGNGKYQLTATCSPAAATFVWTDSDCLDPRYNARLEFSNTCVVTPRNDSTMVYEYETGKRFSGKVANNTATGKLTIIDAATGKPFVVPGTAAAISIDPVADRDRIVNWLGSVTPYYVLGVNAAGTSGNEAKTSVTMPLGSASYYEVYSYATQAPNPFFWSATAVPQYPNSAIAVNFTKGRAEPISKFVSGHVRLVRGVWQ